MITVKAFHTRLSQNTAKALSLDAERATSDSKGSSKIFAKWFKLGKWLPSSVCFQKTDALFRSQTAVIQSWIFSISENSTYCGDKSLNSRWTIRYKPSVERVLPATFSHVYETLHDCLHCLRYYDHRNSLWTPPSDQGELRSNQAVYFIRCLQKKIWYFS